MLILRWQIIVNHCEGEEFFRITTALSGALGFLIFAMAAGLLYQRCIRHNHKIWDRGFTTVDSYILINSLFGLCKSRSPNVYAFRKCSQICLRNLRARILLYSSRNGMVSEHCFRILCYGRLLVNWRMECLALYLRLVC